MSRLGKAFPHERSIYICTLRCFPPASNNSQPSSRWNPCCIGESGNGNSRTTIRFKSISPYWQSAAINCGSKAQRRGNGTQERTQKKAQAKARYYRDADHLLAYAKKYYFRYFPSSAKLKQQLEQKCNDEGIVDQVFREIAPLLNDAENALTVGRRLQSRGRNGQDIRQNLRTKCYDNTIISQTLEALQGDNGSLLDPEVIKRKVKQLRRKGNSTLQIQRLLGGGSEDKVVIAEALAAYENDLNANDETTEGSNNDMDGDTLALHTMLNKFKRQGLSEEKIIPRLQRKGFAYAAIRQALQKE